MCNLSLTVPLFPFSWIDNWILQAYSEHTYTFTQTNKIARSWQSVVFSFVFVHCLKCLPNSNAAYFCKNYLSVCCVCINMYEFSPFVLLLSSLIKRIWAHWWSTQLEIYSMLNSKVRDVVGTLNWRLMFKYDTRLNQFQYSMDVNKNLETVRK